MAEYEQLNLKELAEEALTWIAPTVEEYIRRNKPRRIAAHAVILNPRQKYVPKLELPVLAQRTYGERDSALWPYPYQELALNKANVCWRTGRSNRDVIENAPWLLEKGDVKFPGGVVYNGLIVTFSGFEGEVDEVSSESTARYFWAKSCLYRSGIMADKDRIYI